MDIRLCSIEAGCYQAVDNCLYEKSAAIWLPVLAALPDYGALFVWFLLPMMDDCQSIMGIYNRCAHLLCCKYVPKSAIVWAD